LKTRFYFGSNLRTASLPVGTQIYSGIEQAQAQALNLVASHGGTAYLYVIEGLTEQDITAQSTVTADSLPIEQNYPLFDIALLRAVAVKAVPQSKWASIPRRIVKTVTPYLDKVYLLGEMRINPLSALAMCDIINTQHYILNACIISAQGKAWAGMSSKERREHYEQMPFPEYGFLLSEVERKELSKVQMNTNFLLHKISTK